MEFFIAKLCYNFREILLIPKSLHRTAEYKNKEHICLLYLFFISSTHKRNSYSCFLKYLRDEGEGLLPKNRISPLNFSLFPTIPQKSNSNRKS